MGQDVTLLNQGRRVLPGQTPDMSGLRSLLKLQSPTNKSFDPDQEAAEEASITMNAPHNAFDAARMADTWAHADDAEDRQRGEVDAIRASQVGSRMRGFEDPAQEAGYLRKQEERKLEIPIEAAKAGQSAAMDRLIATQTALNGRTNFVQGEENERNNARIANSHTNAIVPQQMYTAVANARNGYEGGTSKLGRMIGLNGGTREYTQALESLFDRKGTLDDLSKVAARLGQYGGDLDSNIAAAQQDPNFEYDLSGLDDMERAYLALKLGR